MLSVNAPHKQSKQIRFRSHLLGMDYGEIVNAHQYSLLIKNLNIIIRS